MAPPLVFAFGVAVLLLSAAMVGLVGACIYHCPCRGASREDRHDPGCPWYTRPQRRSS